MKFALETYFIVCPFLFLAGLIDAIGGGGGLISLPAYLLAGLPPHAAIATNKLSSACGTSLATFRFYKNGFIHGKLAIPSIIFAMCGSSIGAHLSLLVSEKILFYVMVAILPICTFLVLNKNLFHDTGLELKSLSSKTYAVASISAFFIGMYDGFYGPGTGTFLIIAFSVFAHLGIQSANGQAKVINLTSNLTSLFIFIWNGQVLFSLGIAAAICNMLGGYLGAGLVMKNGTRIVKPSILFVLFLLALKIFGILG